MTNDNNLLTTEEIKPGIYKGVPNEVYHAGPGISKSGLWTIYGKTPAHYKFPPAREPKAHFDFGEAVHLAILEPDEFEKIVYRGPIDRRGNKWKDALEYCATVKVEHRGTTVGQLLLTEGDYDKVMTIRDAVHADPFIHSIITGGGDKGIVEASGYWVDEETGVLCRCRPDLYRADLGVIVDVKSTASAAHDDFMKSVINYGYHGQEAFYSDGWSALGQDVNGFIFLAWEKDSPFAFDVYELPPSIVQEGREIARQQLRAYADCQATGNWYGYRKPGEENSVKEMKFPRWAYKATTAPTSMDEEAA